MNTDHQLASTSAVAADDYSPPHKIYIFIAARRVLEVEKMSSHIKLRGEVNIKSDPKQKNERRD